MSTQQGPQSPRPIDPLLAAVAESVSTGYQMLDHVVEGLRESLRLQAGSPGQARAAGAQAGSPVPARAASALRLGATPPPRHRSAQGPTAGPGNSGDLVQDLAALVAEALGVAGTLVQDVAQTIGEQTHGSPGAECLPTLALSASAGATANTKCTVWNTGPTLLSDVRLSATDLVGPSPLSAETVSFEPLSLAQIAPGKGEQVEIYIAVARDTPPGLRRGVVVASPGDAVALLELTVTADVQPVAAPRLAVEPAEPEAPDRETS